ncbi:hypothetical protein DAEQUDRAFT_604255 [Daedalea quercina L-15889]|uniref:Uncharacterized protein n=1 Tax=Daedalea quercina L-15889 TaxID=1314783 RepID=A0A165LKT7_9APHY|nr:hypothetical protein DAEQUDRAFT_604255 [Daedalea quercina L-15889]
MARDKDPCRYHPRSKWHNSRVEIFVSVSQFKPSPARCRILENSGSSHSTTLNSSSLTTRLPKLLCARGSASRIHLLLPALAPQVSGLPLPAPMTQSFMSRDPRDDMRRPRLEVLLAAAHPLACTSLHRVAHRAIASSLYLAPPMLSLAARGRTPCLSSELCILVRFPRTVATPPP